MGDVDGGDSGQGASEAVAGDGDVSDLAMVLDDRSQLRPGSLEGYEEARVHVRSFRRGRREGREGEDIGGEEVVVGRGALECDRYFLPAHYESPRSVAFECLHHASLRLVHVGVVGDQLAGGEVRLNRDIGRLATSSSEKPPREEVSSSR